MQNLGPDRRLLVQSLGAAAIGALLVAACYAWIDRPVARWMEARAGAAAPPLRCAVSISDALYTAAPLAIAALAIADVFWRRIRWRTVVMTISLNVLVVEALREQLKWVFGRPWPLTWTNHNPSYLGDGLAAFQWFHGSQTFGSFPSGHTAIACAMASVVWVAWPRWRWLGALVVAAVVAGLVANNYHFVGDAVGGGFLGSICGAWAARLAGLTERRSGAVPAA